MDKNTAGVSALRLHNAMPQTAYVTILGAESQDQGVRRAAVL